MKDWFQQNVLSFARFCPTASQLLEKVDCSSLSFCQTDAGELNLSQVINGEKQFFHSQKNAVLELQEMLEKELSSIEILVIWGIGLGYHYDVVKSWLKENPKRLLVFMEHDLRVLHRFLETEKAEQILSDPQVFIQYFEFPVELGWNKFRQEFEWLSWRSIDIEADLTFFVLPFYQRNQPQQAVLLRDQIFLYATIANVTLREFTGDHYRIIIQNLYQNLLHLPNSTSGHAAFGKFSNIPAIVCGAGPSLQKQLPLLKTLSDKALIFGAGTAMNVLNSHGIFPHFGAGLDPTKTQASRVRTNFAYETPYFYANRFNHEAFSKLQGPKIYYKVWQEEPLMTNLEALLGMQISNPLQGGFSTSNFCAYIALFLGCNPIIFVGMDLAYTKKARYSPGVFVHPLEEKKYHEMLQKQEATYTFTGLNGEAIETKLQWMLEAVIFSNIAKNNPTFTFLNATEGGLPLKGIPNISFKKAIEDHLKNSSDLAGVVHQVIETSPFKNPPVQLESSLETWRASLERSQQICQAIQAEFNIVREQFLQSHTIPDSMLTEKAASLETQLNAELVYPYFSAIHEKIFQKISIGDFPSRKYREEDLFLKNLDLESRKYEFLREYITVHLESIQNSLKDFSGQPPIGKPKKTAIIPDEYQCDDHTLKIFDPELEIDLSGPFFPKEKQSLFYPNDSQKAEMFYQSGKLHGPATFFSEDGSILAKSWFFEGLKQGKSWYYKPTGSLQSIQRYKNGKMHGAQEYFYPDGTIRSILKFQNGELDGTVSLYFPNGKIKGEISFMNGKLHGFERHWDSKGQLISESQYDHSQPVNKALQWHPNGQKAKEIVFYDSPEHCDVTEWDEQGKLIQEQRYQPEDSIEVLAKQSGALRNQMFELAAKLKKLREISEEKYKND